MVERKKILIIEDELMQAEALRRVLEVEYEVSVCLTTFEAQQFLIRNVPSLIICDIMMPVKDGLTFIQEIKENELLHEIPVIFLTSLSDDETVIRGLATGAIHFLTKPFQKEKLLLIVTNLLRLKYLAPSNGNSLVFQQESKTLVSQVEEILHREYKNKNLGIELITEELGMSSSNFQRRFRKESGMTLVNYIRNYRLKIARQMLFKGNKNISEVAENCGFASLNYFSRSFRSYFKENPSDILKKAIL